MRWWGLLHYSLNSFGNYDDVYAQIDYEQLQRFTAVKKRDIFDK
jgi:hypothetical protein